MTIKTEAETVRMVSYHKSSLQIHKIAKVSYVKRGLLLLKPVS